MKKIKFIFINVFIFVLISAFFSFAAEPKNTSTSANPAKAAPAATTVVAKGKAQPTPTTKAVSDKSTAQPAPTATVAPTKGKVLPGPIVANVPVSVAVSATKVKAPPAPTAANVTSVPSTQIPAQASSASNQANVYNYNPLGKPDPFLPFIEVELAKQRQKKVESEKKAAVSIFPLQRAETDMYKVVGIVGSDDHRVAIAEDTAQKFYPLLIGTRIGLRNGKVVEILADRIIVEEYENNKGKKVILKLRKN